MVAILTADEVTEIEAPGNPILTNTPHYVGEPIAALAAVDETTAQDAITRVRSSTSSPCLSWWIRWKACAPAAPTPARRATPPSAGEGISEVKWTEADFAARLRRPDLPMGEVTTEWSYGDVEAGFRDADGGARRDLRHRGHIASFDGTAHGDGLLAERQVPRLRLQSQSQSAVLNGLARYIGIAPGGPGPTWANTAGAGFGSKGSRLSDHVGAGPHVQKDRAGR